MNSRSRFCLGSPWFRRPHTVSASRFGGDKAASVSCSNSPTGRAPHLPLTSSPKPMEIFGGPAAVRPACWDALANFLRSRFGKCQIAVIQDNKKFLAAIAKEP